MDINKVLEGLDRLFAENRINEVEEYLIQALREAEHENDDASKLSIMNELIGFYRVTSEFDKAIHYGELAVQILKSMHMETTIPYATTLLNIANAHRASGNLQEALELYKQIEVIYKNNLDSRDFLIASFYNNIALLYQEMGDYESAVDSLRNALAIAETYDNAASETATTYSNLGASLLRLGKNEEAKEMLKEAINRYEKIGERGYHFSSALSAMGELYYREGDYNKSLQYYESAASEIYSVFGENAAYKVMQENISAVKASIQQSKAYSAVGTCDNDAEDSKR